MNFRRRKSAQRIRDFFLRDGSSLVNVHADNHLGCVRTRGDRRAAALSLEFRVLNAAVIQLHPQLHHVATHRVGHFGYSVSVCNLANTSRVLEIVEQFFGVGHGDR